MTRTSASAMPKKSDHTRKDTQEIRATCRRREIPFGA